MTALILLLAGVAGGLSGSIAGLASLVSYPALLACGLPPVQANVTNAVSLVFGSLGSVSASRTELSGQKATLIRLTPPSIAGGVLGAGVLLISPAGTFELIVPALIAAASLAILAPWPHAPARRDRSEPAWLLPTVFVNGVYAGYFGAAAGVMLLAVLLGASVDSLPRINACKNVILGLGNGLAACVFVAFGHVAWRLALPLAVGLFVGGRLGPWVVRRTPARTLRMAIAFAGLVLAVHLGVSAY